MKKREGNMRKLLVIALLVNAALLTVITFREFSGVEAGGGRVATENGETNGDGARDISIRASIGEAEKRGGLVSELKGT